jgi:malate dehydrogenase (oxaloacetate-decarboxylating)
MLIEKGTDKAVYTLRLIVDDGKGSLGRVFVTIDEAGAGVGDITRVGTGLNHTTRDVDVLVNDQSHLDRLLEKMGKLEGTRIQGVFNHVEEMHKGGKIEMRSRLPIHGISDIRKLYTPGVAYICKRIQEEPALAAEYTYLRSTVAIVTNGTAILGLGDIGVTAGMPVMEGKSLLFSVLVKLNGIPVLVDSKDPDEIVRTVELIAPGFGAIQLEDIAAPDCFEIEDRLTASLGIPVMHDDQHGTAVVVLASMLNACKYTGLRIRAATIGIIGLGAAGMGIAKLLRAYGAEALIGTDIRPEANEMFAAAGGRPTDLAHLMAEAEIVIATTGVPGLIKPEMVRPRQAIFALSNPNPEIKPDDALAAGAIFAADGRSVNNALAFPGLFRGALDAGAKCFNDEMRIAAAKKIAEEADEGELVPYLLKEGLHARVAKEVELAAFKSGANLSKEPRA